MSFVTKDQRISVNRFAKVPALGRFDLPAILRDDSSSVGDVSSLRGSVNQGVDLSEGCLVTKSIRCSHQLAHFVNTARQRSGNPDAVVRRTSMCAVLAFVDRLFAGAFTPA